MFFVGKGSDAFCIDATPDDTPGKGRLISHSISEANLTPVIERFSGDRTPYLVFHAKRDISIGEELQYPYGDDDPDSIRAFPFLAK